MASIRRAQYNGGSPFSIQSPSHKHLLTTSSPSLITNLISSILLFTKPPRKLISWKKAFYRCLLFFFLGFLLGIAHFNYFTDLSKPDDPAFDRFSFEKDVHDRLRASGGVGDDVDVGPETKELTSNPRESGSIGNDDKGGNDVFGKLERLSTVESVKLEVDRVRYDRIENVNESSDDVGKHLIVVTPTYNRGLQSYYLNRLGQVLRLVKPPLLWIVVEMSAASLETAELLRKTGVMYRHLVCGKNLTDVKDRGVHQRNRALEHIELHRLDGIVYFADDDNIYTLEVFESLRKIRRFGTWPVAMLAQSKNKAVLEGPVCNGSQVVGWHTNEKSKRLRRFHVDMSGFAFNSTILWDPKRWRRPTSNLVRQLDTVKEGFQETTFIEQLVEDERQMEGIPHECSKIMNWHLHLESKELDYPKGWVLQKNLDVVLPTK